MELEYVKSFATPKKKYVQPSYYPTGDSVVNALTRIIPDLAFATARCPAVAGQYRCKDTPSSMPITNICVHLNDQHGWTREEIADWLDTLPFDLRVRKDTNAHHRESDEINAIAAHFIMESLNPVGRDEEIQQKLDDAEALLDEIEEAILDETVVEEMVTLSSLMRLGASVTPTVAHGSWVHGLDCPSCALGAAYLVRSKRD